MKNTLLYFLSIIINHLETSGQANNSCFESLCKVSRRLWTSFSIFYFWIWVYSW